MNVIGPGGPPSAFRKRIRLFHSALHPSEPAFEPSTSTTVTNRRPGVRVRHRGTDASSAGGELGETVGVRNELDAISC